VSRFVEAVCCLVLFCAMSICASAQMSTATMFGNITDPMGAAIPKATVTLTQTDTGFTRTLVTKADGSYRADFLPVGPYKVSVTAQGFKKLDREGLTLTVTEEAHLDLPLQVGNSDMTVEVTAEVPLLNTGNSVLGRTVTNVEIDNLPLVDRNVYTLLDLTPGVQNNNGNGAGGNGGVTNPQGFPEQHVKINGSSDSTVGQVAYYLDGGSNMTGVRNTGNPLPNPDAIREFRVDTNNFSAQYGRNSAGVVSVLTKSGTDQFHGSVFEFFRDRNFNATTHTFPVKTPYNQHRFGFTVGGPAVHDKLFFFGSYAGFRFISANETVNASAPSAAMLQGNFSENLPTTRATPGTECTVAAQSATRFYACNPYKPKASALYPGNIVPVTDFDPTIYAMIKAGLIPTANPTQATDTIYTRRDLIPYRQMTDEQLYKADYQMTQKQRLTFSYFHVTGDYELNPGGNNVLNWMVHHYTFVQHEANVADTWTISNNTVNQLTLNYTRLFGSRVPMPTESLANYGSKFTEQLPNGHICGVPAEIGCSRPQFTVSGWFTAANAISGSPSGSNIYSIRDVVSSTHGRHTLYFGGEVSRENDANVSTLFNYGAFSFTGHTNTANRSSAAITDFLFGSPNNMEQDVPVYANANYFNYGVFLQDDWRALPNLTINLGIRYDIQTAPTDTQSRTMNFVPGRQSTVAPSLPLGILVPGDAGVPESGAGTRYSHVSPRVGLAWTPYANGRTVIHAAAGIFYGSVAGNLFIFPSNGEPFSGRPTFNSVIHVSDPYASDPKDFCSGSASCIAAGVGHSPFPFIYDPKNPQFVVKPAALITMDPNFHWPEIYQINFGFQQQLTNSFALSASYVASLGRKLPIEWDVNYPLYNVNAGASGPSCFLNGTTTPDTSQPCGYANASSTINNRRPYNSSRYGATTATNPLFQNILQIQSSESTNYNGLQVSAQQRLTNGFSVQGYWAWSKDLQSENLDLPGNTGASQDPNNRHLDRQRSDFDIRHMAAFSAVWKPHYVFDNVVARQVVNGWTVTAIVRIQSGQPFNITTGTDNNLDGVSNDRPNLAPGVVRARVKDNGGSRTAMMKQWFDPSQFCIANGTLNGVAACPQNGAGPANSDGTLRANALDGPGHRGVDASLFREFRIYERLMFQLRGESTNVFNLTNLPQPQGNLGSAQVGQDAGTTLGGNFGNRVIQVGGRILF
jgi:outer membrane receptor protein involved in Fe transport